MLAIRRRELVLGTAASLLMSGGGSRRPQPMHALRRFIRRHRFLPTASLGQGKDRALVLGGGGEYFIAWLLGFARGLHSAGVSYDLAEVIVGTSAGAIVGTAIAADHLGLLRDDFDFFGLFPKLLADLVPTRAENSSQARARTVAEAAHDASSGHHSGASAAPPWRLTIPRFAISS